MGSQIPIPILPYLCIEHFDPIPLHVTMLHVLERTGHLLVLAKDLLAGLFRSETRRLELGTAGGSNLAEPRHPL